MTEPRIRFERVWKKFHRGQLHDSLRDLIPDVARRLVGRGVKEIELDERDFWAVRDLSFDVRPGQSLGIIGPNGSGKSTTLKMLTRIMVPSRGYSEVRGRFGALIEVSGGFHGDLTGAENIYLQGAIMGMRSSEIKHKFDRIVEFAGVADAIDTPVKRYSSGMNARLGFAIAAHMEPEVLIIDEVLATGDLQFQDKAFGRVRELATSGIPVVVVSHQLERIAELCSEVILLDHGEVITRGSAEEVIDVYIRRSNSSQRESGDGPVRLESAWLVPDAPVESGQYFAVEVCGHVTEPLGDVDPVVVQIRSLRTGRFIYVAGSRKQSISFAPGPFRVRIELQANLAPGRFTIEVAARDTVRKVDVANAPSIVLHVTDPGNFFGIVQLNASMARL